MIGSNELHLCKAEMMVALQEYLDKRMGPYAPEVFGIGERDGTFRIILVERKDRAEGEAGK